MMGMVIRRFFSESIKDGYALDSRVDFILTFF